MYYAIMVAAAITINNFFMIKPILKSFLQIIYTAFRLKSFSSLNRISPEHPSENRLLLTLPLNLNLLHLSGELYLPDLHLDLTSPTFLM
jgi:hypothetical protein